MSKEKRLVKITPGDGAPMVSVKQSRNQPCGCGSSKKQKHCCGAKTEYYSTKPLMPPESKSRSGTIVSKTN
ncbi:hypothetical protein [Sunxiuqinia sp. sy24]|uniref:hypothetical protein n=1 Tax=Sunxiuqinia sp. sy24 TaxID=3461495 RepID=UPI00404594A6